MSSIAPVHTDVVTTATPTPSFSVSAAHPGVAPVMAMAPDQRASALDGIHTLDPKAIVQRDRYTHAATFASGSFQVTPDPALAGQKDAVSQTFLAQSGSLFGAGSADTQLQLVTADSDNLGFEHDKYQETYKGLPVFGQQIVVHSKGDIVTSAAGRLTPNLNLDTQSRLSQDDAFSKVQATLKPLIRGAGLDLANSQLGIYTSPTGKAYLAYQLDVKSGEGTPDFGTWRYMVDAQTGRTLTHWSTLETALNRNTYSAGNQESGQGTLERKEGQGPVADATVNEAHDNAKSVYDFYSQNFGRDSIDGKGMSINSIVHWGQNYNNAYWDGSEMTYGDGDGKEFADFAKGLDVVGHEMTHGVTENTAGLNYSKQSGALNESWSDVMGELIQRWQFAKDNPGAPDPDPQYLMGEDIFTPGTPGDALRSMSNPGHAYPGDPQPADMAHYKNTFEDNGGVHLNSGIPNHAAYLIAKAIGDDKLAQIWYRADAKYLTPNAQFKDAANVTVQAAVDLYGAASPEVQAVRTAWTQVGLPPKA